jgi:LPPG:FO 2-phospho-L-lactate transferase
MLASLGVEVSPVGVARMYEGLVDGMVIDGVDEGVGDRIEALGMRVLATAAVMRDAPDRARLAREVLDFGTGLVTL